MTTYLLALGAILTTAFIGLFIVMWVIDGIKMATTVMGWVLGVIAALLGIALFWFWVFGVFS